MNPWYDDETQSQSDKATCELWQRKSTILSLTANLPPVQNGNIKQDIKK